MNLFGLFNKLFSHEQNFSEPSPKNDLVKCSQNDYLDKNDNYIESYEKSLISASECVTRDINNFPDLRILIIADLHGHFKTEWKNISENDYDVCFLLGDNTKSDLEHILKYVPLNKIFGVLGNHDELYYYDMFGIPNINGQIVECNGIRIAGIEGCVSYKTGMPGFSSQTESIIFSDLMNKADVLIFHSNPFLSGYQDDIHDGLMGVTNYLYKSQVPFCIHGHIHENKKYTLQNGTTVLSCCGVQLISLRNMLSFEK